MKFKKWMEKATTDEMRELAKMIECHYLYLYQIAQGSCSAGLAKKIEKYTTLMNPKRSVPKHMIRPDIWDKPKKR